MEKIVLANQEEVECVSFALASVGYLFIRVRMSLAEAASFFSDPEKLSLIRYVTEDGNAIAISNFTELAYIVREDDVVRIALQQPVQYVEEVGNDA